MTSVRDEVMTAYCDCYENDFKDCRTRRQLSFKASESVNKNTAIRIFNEATPRGYNDFAYYVLACLPDDCEITIAREGSVCIYVKGKLPLECASILQANEYSYDEGSDETRIWWD